MDFSGVLFIFPKGDAPKAIYILYLLAWRYIITDFYRIHYENITFSEESILIRIIERYTTLCKALLLAYETVSARTAQAGMGRQPKKRIDIGDLRPVFHINDRGGLKPSEELAELATKLRIADRARCPRDRRTRQMGRIKHRYNQQRKAPREAMRARRDPTTESRPRGSDTREKKTKRPARTPHSKPDLR